MNLLDILPVLGIFLLENKFARILLGSLDLGLEGFLPELLGGDAFDLHGHLHLLQLMSLLDTFSFKDSFDPVIGKLSFGKFVSSECLCSFQLLFDILKRWSSNVGLKHLKLLLDGWLVLHGRSVNLDVKGYG